MSSGAEQRTEPIVVGEDHVPILSDFYRSEVYHRADVAHVTGDLFAMGAMNAPDSTSAEALGEGWWLLYDWEADVFPSFGSFGEGVRTVRVADGCRDSYGTRWAWYAWERNGNVYFDRLSSGGTWGGPLRGVGGARNPVVVRGTNNAGVDRVALLYELTVGGTSSLLARFLTCGGDMGPLYSLRSVGTPWRIWHIEAAFNTHLDHWRIFWDEYRTDTWFTDMRTKYLEWSGTQSTSTLVGNCVGGGGILSEPQTYVIPAASEELPPEEIEESTYPDHYGEISDISPLAYPEGCRRFFASFDPGEWNATHRFLVSWYSHVFWFIGEDGAIDEAYNNFSDPRGGDLNIPLTGVCNVSSCSYQEIGICTPAQGSYQKLSHRRFTDNFNACQGGDDVICDHRPAPGGDPNFQEMPVTPTGFGLYPLAMAVNDEVAVVLYAEDTRPTGDLWGILACTTIDN